MCVVLIRLRSLVCAVFWQPRAWARRIQILHAGSDKMPNSADNKNYHTYESMSYNNEAQVGYQNSVS